MWPTFLYSERWRTYWLLHCAAREWAQAWGAVEHVPGIAPGRSPARGPASPSAPPTLAHPLHAGQLSPAAHPVAHDACSRPGGRGQARGAAGQLAAAWWQPHTSPLGTHGLRPELSMWAIPGRHAVHAAPGVPAGAPHPAHRCRRSCRPRWTAGRTPTQRRSPRTWSHARLQWRAGTGDGGWHMVATERSPAPCMPLLCEKLAPACQGRPPAAGHSQPLAAPWQHSQAYLASLLAISSGMANCRPPSKEAGRGHSFVREGGLGG